MTKAGFAAIVQFFALLSMVLADFFMSGRARGDGSGVRCDGGDGTEHPQQGYQGVCMRQRQTDMERSDNPWG